MPVALLLLSLGAAITCGAAAWVAAGFLWGLAAYAGAGAATMLGLAVIQTAASSSDAQRSSRISEGEALT